LPCFVTATAALHFWQDDKLHQGVVQKGMLVEKRLQGMVDKLAASRPRCAAAA
jgi:diaminobutyrate-2-oxoglutarate transaminase